MGLPCVHTCQCFRKVNSRMLIITSNHDVSFYTLLPLETHTLLLNLTKRHVYIINQISRHIQLSTTFRDIQLSLTNLLAEAIRILNNLLLFSAILALLRIHLDSRAPCRSVAACQRIRQRAFGRMFVYLFCCSLSRSLAAAVFAVGSCSRFFMASPDPHSQ